APRQQFDRCLVHRFSSTGDKVSMTRASRPSMLAPVRLLRARALPIARWGVGSPGPGRPEPGRHLVPGPTIPRLAVAVVEQRLHVGLVELTGPFGGEIGA